MGRGRARGTVPCRGRERGSGTEGYVPVFAWYLMPVVRAVRRGIRRMNCLIPSNFITSSPGKDEFHVRERARVSFIKQAG